MVRQPHARGEAASTVGPPGDYRNPDVDLAEEHVVANVLGENGDIWVFDPKRGTSSRLTFDPANDSDPVFSPDGRWVMFYSTRTPIGIYRKAASGAGTDELIASTGPQSYPRDWSLDGRFVLFAKANDLWIVPNLGADGRLMSVNVETTPDFKLDAPKPVFQTPLMDLSVGSTRRYNVSADGQRFLMNVPVGGETLSPITVIVNWQSGLKNR